MEDILEHKPGTQAELGPQHAKCTRAKKPMYKVRWLGWAPAYDSWVCQCSVGQAALDEYAAQRASARPKKKVGRLAAAWDAALDQCQANEGDFAVSAKDEISFNEVACDCLKEFQYAEKKQTTAGILALVSSCGLFLKMDEIFGSESMSQVYLFLYDTFYLEQVPPPKVLAYDDACHLSKFLINRIQDKNSAFAEWLILDSKAGVKIVCDRFHFPNHKSCVAARTPTRLRRRF